MLPLKVRYGAELVEALLLVSQRVAPTALESVQFGFRHPVLEDALEAILR
jgi:NAD dependent epimerase/dehydratase family enzyme